MSLNDRIRERLATMITNLGGTVPALPSPTDEENRTLALLDSLAAQLSGRVVVSVALQVAQLACYIFVADRAYRVERIELIYASAEVTAAALALRVNQKIDGNTLSSGGLQIVSFNIKSAAETLYTNQPANITLSAGHRLSVELSGAATEFVKPTLTVYLVPA